MAKKSISNISRASVLAFERKISPSPALFYSTKWAERKNYINSIPLQQMTVRGVISNDMKTTTEEDILKLNNKIRKPNIQTCDMALLPNDQDTLVVDFTLLINSISDPSVCNNMDYRRSLKEELNKIKTIKNLKEISHRYATNIANGRFLWRNRKNSSLIEVVVKVEGNEPLIFNSHDYSMEDFSVHTEELTKLTNIIHKVIENDHILLNITAYAKIGNGQEVFPSQEFVEKEENKDGRKTKVLYSVNNIAAFHSQKIGNAIRTIDTWYPDYEKFKMPIAIEAYGQVTTWGHAFRGDSKVNFYDIIDKLVLNKSELTEEEEIYVLSNIIRGGVFGGSEKD